MKYTKITCDICNKEIDIEKEESIGAFEYLCIELKPFMQLNQTSSKIKTDKKVTKIFFDLCNKCSDETKDFLNKRKIEMTKNKS